MQLRMPKFLSSVGWAGVVMAKSIVYFPYVLCHRRACAELANQLYATGIRTLPVVTVVSLFTGMILSLQVGIELARYNQEIFLGAAVMLTMIRDMAAFACGICLASCVGSAIAAELGTMKVNDEIDALMVMDIPPMRFLVAPRVLALILMSPLVAFYCMIVGTVGGAVVGETQLNVDFAQFMSSAMSIVKAKDLYVGLVKAAVFGLLIGTVSAAEGLGTTNGGIGVGKSTQRAVIVSFLSILVFGYMITRICYQ